MRFDRSLKTFTTETMSTSRYISFADQFEANRTKTNHYWHFHSIIIDRIYQLYSSSIVLTNGDCGSTLGEGLSVVVVVVVGWDWLDGFSSAGRVRFTPDISLWELILNTHVHEKRTSRIFRTDIRIREYLSKEMQKYNEALSLSKRLLFSLALFNLWRTYGRQPTTATP